MRILIIEDDKDLAQLTKLALEKENFTVDICLDGAEGLYYMQENMYDLVLLDRMLPSMDGTQVLKEARQSNISTPVIFLTALGELQDKVNGLNCGADDYMVKPFAFEELLARIHSIMRRPGKWGDLNLLKLGDIAFDPECGRLTYVSVGGRMEMGVKENEKYFQLYVQDNGPGISDENKEAVFRRFYRADPARKEKQHFGLGLCIAREIVTLHKGSIRILDTPGGGSTFVIRLPK